MNSSYPDSGSSPEPGLPAYGSPGPEGPRPTPPPGERFFGAVRSLGIVRPDQGRWVAGVCAGLARRWGVRPIVVRGLFVVFALVFGFGLALYGLAWLLLPQPDGRIHAQQVLTGTVSAGFVGAVLAILIDRPRAPWADTPWAWHTPSGPLLLILVALGVVYLVRRGRQTPPGN